MSNCASPKSENCQLSSTNKLNRILIVDDEPGVCRSVGQILTDEGYECLYAHDGIEALAKLDNLHKSNGLPILVILDVWLPGGLDGIESLRELKSRFPSIPVIMISGHASINTALEAKDIGAEHFLEKPLEIENLIHTVNKFAGISVTRSNQSEVSKNRDSYLGLTGREGESLNEGRLRSEGLSHPVSRKYSNIQEFRDLFYPSFAVPFGSQRTIKSTAILYGIGLHSGKKTGLILEPLPPYSGIYFTSVNGGDTVVPAHLSFVSDTGFATTLRNGDESFSTVEHLCSAIRAYGITNLLIKCNSEVPIMDGSALEFCKLIEQIGIEDQGAPGRALKLERSIDVTRENESLRFFPAEDFSIKYELSYPLPIGDQGFEYKLDQATYIDEIAPARTFGLVSDISRLQNRGLALGGRFDNFILVGNSGPINGNLRFDNEFARHKILDIIGDLSLIGLPILGRVEASMTGHSDNIALGKSLLQAFASVN